MRWIRGLLTAALLMIAGGAWGQECTIATAPVRFGQYMAIDSPPVDAVGDILVICSAGTPFMVKLDPGDNPAGNFHPRKLRPSLSGTPLDYNLYRDPARTEVWGDGTSGTFLQTGVGSGAETIFHVYGRIPGRQRVGAGTFRDSIAVTVEW